MNNTTTISNAPDAAGFSGITPDFTFSVSGTQICVNVTPVADANTYELFRCKTEKGRYESILRSELSISCDSVKAMKDKLMIGGEAVLHILYVTELETGAQDTMTFSIPYSQVLDIRGVSDSAQNQVQLEVMSYETTLKSEFDENSTLVSLDAKICATAAAFEDEEITIAEDAYSTEYELELKKKPYTFSRLTSVLKETFSAKDEIQTGENTISKVIDLVLYGIDNSSVCYIISEHSDELITEITSGRVHRGVTILNGAGAYSGKPEKILMCVIKRNQISEFRRLIRSIDPHSFCIVTDAKDVFGKGFENIAEVK